MSGLEIALIILVVIWSLIFLIIAIALIVLFWGVKKGIDKINNILENTQSITQNIASPLSKAVTGANLLKDVIGTFVKFKKGKTKKLKVLKK